MGILNSTKHSYLSVRMLYNMTMTQYTISLRKMCLCINILDYHCPSDY